MSTTNLGGEPADGDGSTSLRSLTRSPHPYSRQSFELPHPADRLILRPSPTSSSRASNSNRLRKLLASPFPDFYASPAASDSGTEADDEHFLRGLPAPRPRLHKGVRGRHEPPSSSFSSSSSSSAASALSTPVCPSPGLPGLAIALNIALNVAPPADAEPTARRIRMVLRRTTETTLLAILTAIVVTNPNVRPLLADWGPGIAHHSYSTFNPYPFMNPTLFLGLLVRAA